MRISDWSSYVFSSDLGLALEHALDELAALGEPEDLRQRPVRHVALQAFHRARRERQHAVRRLAAQHLLPGPGDHVELLPRQVHGERSEERRVGKEWVSTWKSLWSPAT